MDKGLVFTVCVGGGKAMVGRECKEVRSITITGRNVEKDVWE